MKKQTFSIEKIPTKDKIELNGLISYPARSKKGAVIFVHGFTGNALHGAKRSEELAKAANKAGYAYGIFNNRGHDIIASFVKKLKTKEQYKTFGAGMENFTDCVFDIKTMIDFFSKQGYKKIYLLGHSTGANKVLYYQYKTQDKRVSGIALLGGVSDIAADSKNRQKKFNRTLKKVVAINRKNKNAILPADIYPFPISANRYVSLFKPGEAEDVFPYHNSKATWKELRSIKKPVAVIIGEKDQYLDRSASEFVKIFKAKSMATSSFFSKIITNADHSFHDKEKHLAKVVMSWVGQIK